jgi:predicted peroxiredoxin
VRAIPREPAVDENRRYDTVATTILTNCTCGKENPERATLPFVVGNVAASADQPAIVLLTIEGVWIATKGYAEGIHKEGFQPLREIMDSFLANGGQIWACGACTKPRGITDEHLIPGARIVTAAMVVEAMGKGAASLSF